MEVDVDDRVQLHGDGRVQDLGIDAVPAERFHPDLGIPAAGVHVGVPPAFGPHLVVFAHDAGQQSDGREAGLVAQEAVGGLLMHQPRRPVAVTLLGVDLPQVVWLDDVRVGRNDLVVSSHWRPPSSI